MASRVFAKLNLKDQTEILVIDPPRSFEAELDHLEIVRTCFLHGKFDCAVEIRAPTLTGINKVVESIRQMDGVSKVQVCTITHSWVRTPIRPV